jgi:CRP/FNR family transcriptional regulator, dissimilatory nitrate respiration regulator
MFQTDSCSQKISQNACCGACDKSQTPSEISKLQLFQGLSANSLGLIQSNLILAELDKGEVLFLQEDKADFVYVIRSGWVKLFRETIEGHEAVLDILTRGHIFGDTAIFNDAIHQYGAQIVEQAHFYKLPIPIMQDLIQQYPQFALNMMRVMARYRRQQDMEVEHRSLQNAPQRIGCFLLRLLGKNDVSGSKTIEIPYDKSLLAGRLGMKPETLSRGLARLKDDLHIGIKGGSVFIPDIEKLIDYTCQACTTEFPCSDI